MSSKISLCCFLLLVLYSYCSSAQQQQQKQQQQFGRRQNECSISRLSAQRPSRTIRSEAGVTEVFDHNNEQFQCAGLAVVRYNIEPNGLLLPSWVNAPQLMYFVQGRGLQGVLVTGCPETFQSFQESQEWEQPGRGQEGEEEQGQQGQHQGQQGQHQGQQGQHQGQQGQQGQHQGQQGQGQQEQQGQQFHGDQHQKIREVEEGDAFAVPAGFAHYIFNNGNRRLIVVSVIDISSEANQLDFQPRRFYLAGNPQNEFQQQGGQQQQEGGEGGRQGERHHQQGQQEQQGQQGQQGQQQGEGNNILSGFDAQTLAEAFNVDVQLIRRLQGQNDRRGNIVRVEGGLQAVLPPRRSQEQQQQQDDPLHASAGNGYEETICSVKFSQNIGDPRRADVYTPRGGHRSSVTGYDLPVLRDLVKLSAHKGHLYQNALVLPYYNVNANSVIYVIRGSARIQVVQEEGQTVANEEVQQGQVFVVPQNFAALIKARDSGFEYVAIKTDENARINTLAGDLSLLRALPVQVIASAFQTSINQAQQLKHNRQESTIGPPGSRSQYV